MFDKLNAVLDRFRELDEEIAQPEVIQDYEKYQACLKERSALQPLVDKYTEYLALSRHREEAAELLSDPLFADEAEAEISHLSAKCSELTEELKIMLVPPDPMDSRNVILEIRAGVGGEEAALFAGDLMRMYQKYADRNGLSSEILSLSDTDLRRCLCAYEIRERRPLREARSGYRKRRPDSHFHCNRCSLSRSP